MRGLLVEWLEVVMIPWGLSVPPFTKVHKIGLSLHQLHQRLKGNTYWDSEMRKKIPEEISNRHVPTIFRTGPVAKWFILSPDENQSFVYYIFVSIRILPSNHRNHVVLFPVMPLWRPKSWKILGQAYQSWFFCNPSKIEKSKVPQKSCRSSTTFLSGGTKYYLTISQSHPNPKLPKLHTAQRPLPPRNRHRPHPRVWRRTMRPQGVVGNGGPFLGVSYHNNDTFPSLETKHV